MSQAGDMLAFCAGLVGQGFTVLGNVDFFEYKLWQIILALAFGVAFVYWSVKQITGKGIPDSAFETGMYRIDRSNNELQSLDAGGWHDRFDGDVRIDRSYSSDDLWIEDFEDYDYSDMEGF